MVHFVHTDRFLFVEGMARDINRQIPKDIREGPAHKNVTKTPAVDQQNKHVPLERQCSSYHFIKWYPWKYNYLCRPYDRQRQGGCVHYGAKRQCSLVQETGN